MNSVELKNNDTEVLTANQLIPINVKEQQFEKINTRAESLRFCQALGFKRD